MIYQFEDIATGELIDCEYPIGEAPGIGCVVTRGDRELRRLPSRPGALRTPGSTHFTDTVGQLPYRWKAHEKAGGTFDSEGRCQFGSSDQVRKTMEQAKRMGEPITYNGATVKPLVSDIDQMKRAARK